MINFFRMLFDWSKVKEERDELDEALSAASRQHAVAAKSLTDLLVDMQKHGAIAEKPALPIEPNYKLHS